MFNVSMSEQSKNLEAEIVRLKNALQTANALVIGAGAGLSTAAGFSYSGARFEKYFPGYKERYGFNDMYSGGFYPYESLEEFWAYWSRAIMCNRYSPCPTSLYTELLALVQKHDYFVITTNVDHQFQEAGFDKKRLYYTQGDYGLFQCSKACHQKTYDNKEAIQEMFRTQENFKIPSALIPKCPVCGAPMTTNLRIDNYFVEDEGWHNAAMRYSEFLRRHESMNTLYLELGVGWNTPSIIKFPFWQYTAQNPQATYACLNFGETYCPPEIAKQSILLDADLADVIAKLKN